MTSTHELYQEIIIDHGRRPRNFFACLEANRIKEGFNPLCGDKLTVYLSEHHDVVEAVSFQGCGCAISMASASLMTEIVKGKTMSEVEVLFKIFHAIVTTGKDNRAAIFSAYNVPKGQVSTDVSELELNKLAVFAGVYEYPARVKCATLAWHTLMATIQDSSGGVSTEEEPPILLNKPIISFTESAAQHIKKSIANDPANIGFRLATKKSGCTGFAYMPEIIQTARTEDIYFLTENDVPVYIDPQSVDIIQGTVLDFIDKGPWQKQLVFNNPNVKDQCGCGESFSVEEKEKQSNE